MSRKAKEWTIKQTKGQNKKHLKFEKIKPQNLKP